MAKTPLETEQPEKEEPTPDTTAAQEAAAEDAAEETIAAEPSDEMSTLLEKLDALTAEANGHRDRALRAVAEMENYRRRSVREKDEARKFANQNLLENFLPILDNFALGLDHARQHEGGKAFADGFAMILTQIENWLNGHGVVRIAPGSTEEFDPNYHESVAHVPHPKVAEHCVVEVTRIGYRLHDRLLRPAAVVVSSGPPADGAGEEAKGA